MSYQAPPSSHGVKKGARVAFVVARYNDDITKAMLEAATRRANELAARVVAQAEVYGTFDLALVARELARRRDVDAVVAIGCVVTGETGHDEVVAGAAANALANASLQTGKPIALAVTGPRQTREQAKARIDRAPAAVESALKTLQTLADLQ